MQTITIENQNKGKIDNGRRTKRHFDFGAALGHLLRQILPQINRFGSVTDNAAATCRFTVQGPDAVGDPDKGQNWGRWIRTRMQTHGEHPIGAKWQVGARFVTADSEDAANSILVAFGIDVDEVYRAWGQPDTGVVYVLDLVDIVTELRPELLTVGTPHVADTMALAGSLTNGQDD